MPHHPVPALLATVLAAQGVAGCGSSDADDGVGTSAGATSPSNDTTSAVGDETTAQGDASGTATLDPTTPSTTDDGASEGPGPSPPSRVDGLDFICKLINGTSASDPSANQTHTRFNLRDTDLGIPLVIGPLLHIFFGDTHGYREIWSIGEDPDSVAFIAAALAAVDPSVLCTDLSFYVTPDIPSIAADTDPAVQRDFAVGWMTPPVGEDIAEYITHHAGPFTNIPGSFEVPSGALAVGDDVYLFWAGKAELEPYARMNLGYLARWDAPRELPQYQIVRPIDALEDGALGGHFIQVLPLVEDDTLYLFGTGEFRRSGIHLARMPVAAIETGVGQDVWDPGAAAWIDPAALDAAARAAIPPVVETDGVGELGGMFVPGPDVYLLMYQQITLSNRVIVRTAPHPTGPWSEPLTVIDMADPAFMLQHCCLDEPCVGEQIWQCNSAGLYGAYPLPNPRITAHDDGSFAVALPFVVSTWMPYNVVLFEAQLTLAPGQP
jgi:uncharacterized protein DUF4185